MRTLHQFLIQFIRSRARRWTGHSARKGKVKGRDYLEDLGVEGRIILWRMLKARTVEGGKQPLLGNGPYTHSKEARRVCCDVMQQ